MSEPDNTITETQATSAVGSGGLLDAMRIGYRLRQANLKINTSAESRRLLYLVRLLTLGRTERLDGNLREARRSRGFTGIATSRVTMTYRSSRQRKRSAHGSRRTPMSRHRPKASNTNTRNDERD